MVESNTFLAPYVIENVTECDSPLFIHCPWLAVFKSKLRELKVVRGIHIQNKKCHKDG